MVRLSPDQIHSSYTGLSESECSYLFFFPLLLNAFHSSYSKEAGGLMFERMLKKVLDANKLLWKYGLVTYTWGNVSEIDRLTDYIAIKPSGVQYDHLSWDDIVVVDMDGNLISGKLGPSIDIQAHVEIYKAFPDVGGVVHTHSPWATAWAQSGRPIPCYGTTQADCFFGEIPCTRKMREDELGKDYEKNIGKIIAETFKDRDPMAMPSVLVNGHGTFSWGVNAKDAVHNAIVLETSAALALRTEMVNHGVMAPLDDIMQTKCYYRKHRKHGHEEQVMSE